MKKTQLYPSIGSFITSFVILIFFWFYLYRGIVNKEDEFFVPLIKDNLVIIYILGLLFFLLLYVVIYLLISRCSYKFFLNGSEFELTNNLVCVAIICCGIIGFIHWDFVDQFKEKGVIIETMNDIPNMYKILFIVVCTVGVYCVIVKDHDVLDYSLWSVFTLSLVIPFLQTYINPYSGTANSSGDFTIALCDFSSVTETIYNVYDFVPFDAYTTGLYGHYSLFFLIPLKLMGRCTPRKIMFLLSLCSVFAQFCTNYVIYKFAPRKWVAILLILASVIRTTYSYFAIFPIRIFFPLLFCAVLAILSNKVLSKKTYIYLLLVLTCALLWNIETGVACAAGVIAFGFLKCIRNKGLNCRKKFLYVLILSIGEVAALLFSIGITNIYNYICGGEGITLDYFFPYLNTKWVYDTLTQIPPVGNHMWIYIILLFLGGMVWGFIDQKDCSYCMFSYSVMGLVLFTYYMNEAHWGCMEIVHQLCMCIIVIILARLWNHVTIERKNDFMHQLCKGIVGIALFVCIYLAFYTYTDGVRIAARNKAGAYDFESYKTDVEEIADIIPQEAFGVGQGVNGIYHSLGKSNHIKMIDSSAWDLDMAINNKAMSEILKHDVLFISSDRYDEFVIEKIVLRDDRYRIIEEYYINGLKYYVMKR